MSEKGTKLTLGAGAGITVVKSNSKQTNKESFPKVTNKTRHASFVTNIKKCVG